MKKSFLKSNEMLRKTLEVIPLASQTFSKSHIQFPKDFSPVFLEKGKGAEVWDIDGNQYIDFISALMSIILGYCDEDVDNAVINQMKKGVSFSLAHPLEFTLAERLVSIIPCAEMVRFGKNATDSTTAAIRIARAVTQKKHILHCGYHGWNDWYIAGTTRNLGIPEEYTALIHDFQYNDLSSLEKRFSEYKNQVAAVIMEPMNFYFPENDFLQKVKALCHQNGAVFILDETITGFRFSLGGAQSYFNVTPDLAIFGKGMANGYPLSALVGSKPLMQHYDQVFLSSTFGGETISIAAAIATIEKLEKHKINEQLQQTGINLSQKFNLLLEKYQLNNEMILTGHPTWLSIKYLRDTEFKMKTFMIYRLIEQGILIQISHNINASHTKEHIDQCIKAYDIAFSELSEALKSGSLDEILPCAPIEPIFKIR
jgi:glutamate-1-semialdehyde 2,1-aminomutase